jgi:hypothetical protein
LRFLVAAGTCPVSLFHTVRGRRPRTDQERSSPRLEPTLPQVQHQTKEDSHGKEEEKEENGKKVMRARASYWGRAFMTL